MTRFLTLISLAMLLSFNFSCEKEEFESQGAVEFSFSLYKSDHALLKSSTSEKFSNVASVVVSITHESGRVVFQDKIIKLFKFNNEFINEPLAIEPGSYRLTKYLVINDEDSVLYATPHEHARLSYLVSNSLPIDFLIEKDKVTKITPEVLSTEERNPNDFGYGTFGISLVDVFDFLVAVFIFNPQIENFELTDASIIITSKTDTLFSSDLRPITYKVTVKDHYSVYKIKIIKPGYGMYQAEFSADLLKLHLEDPLTIILRPSKFPVEGLIAYYPFDGNTYDHSGNNNHCIEHSEGKYQEGISSTAHYFNGKSDYLELSETLNGSKGLSFSFWIWSKGVLEGENNGTIVCKYNMMTDYTCFSVTTWGFLSSVSALHGNFYASRYSTDLRDCAWSEWQSIEDIPLKLNPQYFTIYNPMEIPLYEWVHCVINVTQDEIQAWVNGIPCVNKKREYDKYLDDPNEPTYIGNNLLGGQGSNNHFHGLLDELRIYNRSLTPEEIQALYQN